MAAPDPHPEDRLRISDADRDATAARLRAAVDEGRLSLWEYDARLRDVYAASTRGELAVATADLPAPAPQPPREPAAPASRRTGVGRAVGEPWRGWLGGALVMLAIWAATSVVSGTLLPFWPAFPIGIWGAVLLAGALGGGCGTRHRA